MERMLDARGLACPLPVVNAKKAVEEMHDGDVLVVLVDNEIAVQNLQRFATHKGFAASGEKKGEKEYSVTIVISGSAAASNEAAQALYAGLGYVQVGRRPNYYHNPKEDALILRKEWDVCKFWQ